MAAAILMVTSALNPPDTPPLWREFICIFLAGGGALALAVLGFIALLDPYGLRAARPIMDSDQRFMYPQIARSGAFDGAIFGTSTARLIDPRALGPVFGARFANLAINAATPYEQMRLAKLYLGATAPKAVLFALDGTWCEADADRRRFTQWTFPAWLYDGSPVAVLRQANWQGLGIAAQGALHRLGLVPERIRGDGYAVFTPPEVTYDAARAAAHIRAGAAPADIPGFEVEAPMPALDWLDRLLAEMPRSAVALMTFMPVHVAAQGKPGTRLGAREAICKARVAEIGRRFGATVVDFRIPSPVTTQDTNYWDALHYRLPVADHIVVGLAAAQATGRDAEDGFYRVLAHP
ncbi:hypothetical protein LKMONMHP_3780 [Methylobacterium organophilum]|uniref:SGNH/GDSL hydrolase family protein n=2 Tax=Methylobacterium organophilum TaxID=410 RepID=A0ABQ4TB56_METOR|nr:hypothetical protein LKMONMHP_3780 [Methylobacterium organophilum]